MANRAELEARESDCRTIDDFLSLALEAMAETSEVEYARSRLEKAQL